MAGIPNRLGGPLQKADQSFDASTDDPVWIYDDKGYLVAHDSGPNANLEIIDSINGRLLSQWLKVGVPGYFGYVQKGVAYDQRDLVLPNDPLFGLAVRDHLKELGWQILAGEDHRPVQEGGNPSVIRKGIKPTVITKGPMSGERGAVWRHPKAGAGMSGGAWWQECPRDEAGHCLPMGFSDRTGRKKPKPGGKPAPQQATGKPEGGGEAGGALQQANLANDPHAHLENILGLVSKVTSGYNPEGMKKALSGPATAHPDDDYNV